MLNDWKWSYWVSETQIEPPCDRIGQKLSSVDQKVFMIVISLFSDSGVVFYCNQYVDITSLWLRFPAISTWDWLGVLINQDPQTIGLEIQVEFGWNLRILVSLNTEYPWSYPCIGWYTFWYTFWISIQQGQILEGLDPPSTGISCRNHWKRRKIINQCGNGSQPAEIGQKIRFCGTRYFNPESWVFLENPTGGFEISGSKKNYFTI